MLLHVSRHLTHPGRSNVRLFVDSYVSFAYPSSVLCNDVYSCARRSVLHASVFHKFKLKSLHINKLQDSLRINSFVVGNIYASLSAATLANIFYWVIFGVAQCLASYLSCVLCCWAASCVCVWLRFR